MITFKDVTKRSYTVTALLFIILLSLSASATSVYATPFNESAEYIDDDSLDSIARTYDEYDWLFDLAMVFSGTGDTVYDFGANEIANDTLISAPPYQFIVMDVTGKNRLVLFKFTDSTGTYNTSVYNPVYIRCGMSAKYVIDISQGSTYASTGSYYMAYQLPLPDANGISSDFCLFVPHYDVTLEVIYTVKDSIYDYSVFDASESVLVCQKKTVNSWLVIIQKISQYLINIVALVYYVTITILLILVKYILFPALLLSILIGVRFLSKRMTQR
ncbi:hypothetical protein GQ472_02020 [archaeon]|nr:hypothetical protein [archaeon]